MLFYFWLILKFSCRWLAPKNCCCFQFGCRVASKCKLFLFFFWLLKYFLIGGARIIPVLFFHTINERGAQPDRLWSVNPIRPWTLIQWWIDTVSGSLIHWIRSPLWDQRGDCIFLFWTSSQCFRNWLWLNLWTLLLLFHCLFNLFFPSKFLWKYCQWFWVVAKTRSRRTKRGFLRLRSSWGSWLLAVRDWAITNHCRMRPSLLMLLWLE